MMAEMDWNKLFTEVFRNKEIQGLFDKAFHGRKRMKVSREEFEGICVQCLSIMMRDYTGRR